MSKKTKARRTIGHGATWSRSAHVSPVSGIVILYSRPDQKRPGYWIDSTWHVPGTGSDFEGLKK